MYLRFQKMSSLREMKISLILFIYVSTFSYKCVQMCNTLIDLSFSSTNIYLYISNVFLFFIKCHNMQYFNRFISFFHKIKISVYFLRIFIFSWKFQNLQYFNRFIILLHKFEISVIFSWFFSSFLISDNFTDFHFLHKNASISNMCNIVLDLSFSPLKFKYL